MLHNNLPVAANGNEWVTSGRYGATTIPNSIMQGFVLHRFEFLNGFIYGT